MNIDSVGLSDYIQYRLKNVKDDCSYYDTDEYNFRSDQYGWEYIKYSLADLILDIAVKAETPISPHNVSELSDDLMNMFDLTEYRFEAYSVRDFFQRVTNTASLFRVWSYDKM